MYPVEIDKVRNFKYGMKAINTIEKKYKKPVMEIEGISTGSLTMDQYAYIIYAGLQHEDKDITPDKVMDLIDKYTTIGKVAKVMWKAFNSGFGAEEEEEEEEGEEIKNE